MAPKAKVDVVPEKIYNSRILYYYIKLFKEKYTHVDIADLLDYAGIDPHAVEDHLTWFSQNQHNKFFEKMRDYFSNPYDIAREAGLCSSQ